MTVNNKFNIGDKVFFMYENKVVEGTIETIGVDCYQIEDDVATNYRITYSVLFLNKIFWGSKTKIEYIEEFLLYTTKENLIMNL